MIPKLDNSAPGKRLPTSSSSNALPKGVNATVPRKVKNPVVKVLKDDDEETAPPEKKQKSASARRSTKPEFQAEDAGDSKPARKSRQPEKEDSSTSSEGLVLYDSPLTRNNRDRAEKSVSSHATSSVTSPRSDHVGRAILAIERGNLVEFQQLVPQYVPVDSISSQGRSLLAIARFQKQLDIVEYIKQQLTSRAIKAIETGDVEAFKALVPAQVQPDAVSTNGRPLLKIAKYKYQQLAAIIQYLESGIDEDDLPSSVPIANTPGATAVAKSKKVRVIEFYDKDHEYYQFTNFYEGKPIRIDGVSWKTAEHYFQAQKFVGEFVKLQKIVQKKETAREARDFAVAHEKDWRPGWHSVKVDVMRTVLAAKFGQDETLRSLLCETGNAALVEASRPDGFWGYGPDGKGKNMLGKLLMELRTELQEEL